MLISQLLNDKINEQIGYEFAANIQYTAIASHFDAESLPYLARHFYKQAQEEHEHAMKFIKFLIDAGRASKFRKSRNRSLVSRSLRTR
jgi:ferritin